MSHFKNVISYGTRAELTEAFNDSALETNALYHVADGDTYYRMSPDLKGFIEIDNPDSEQNSNILIWWQDEIHCRWNAVLRRQDSVKAADTPILPGSISAMCDSISDEYDRGHRPFTGKLYIPLNLRNNFDPEIIDDVNDDQSLKRVLNSKYAGIPFEIVHYDTIKHYAGIITTLDLGQPDLCAIRDKLSQR